MTDAEARLILGKWIEDATPLLLFLVIPDFGLSLRANGTILRIDSEVFVRFESPDVKCSFAIGGAQFQYADSRDTVTLPYTGRPLQLDDTVCALKIAIPRDLTIILIEPK